VAQWRASAEGGEGAVGEEAHDTMSDYIVG